MHVFLSLLVEFGHVAEAASVSGLVVFVIGGRCPIEDGNAHGFTFASQYFG